MPDVTITTRVLLRIEVGIQNLEAISTRAALDGRAIPAPKASYALGKWGEKVETEANSFRKRQKKEHENASDVDNQGRPKYTDIGNGQVSYAVRDRPALTERLEAMLDEPVTLSGVRPLAIAEFGKFEIPPGEYKVLLGTVIVDAEPA